LDVVGTPYYVAPEVLTGSYGEKCDVWSCGILLYYMVTTRFPFLGKNKTELFAKVKSGQFQILDYFSDDLKDLV
jgi:calcium-dependent protein kinase